MFARVSPRDTLVIVILERAHTIDRRVDDREQAAP
jgi:hypothetical protein